MKNQFPPMFLDMEMLRFLEGGTDKCIYNTCKKIREKFNLPPRSRISIFHYAEAKQTTYEQVMQHLQHKYTFKFYKPEDL